jgi:UPF0271 protein
MSLTIDLNADIGEGMPNDEALMPFISSANIACGYHAGDRATMQQTIQYCLANGVAIGAHPGFADRENFGRTEMQLSPSAIHELVMEQLEFFQSVAEENGVSMHHVKPHGALYNMSARDPEIAEAIAGAVAQFDSRLLLYGLAGSHSVREAEKYALRTVNEFFADRTYQPSGQLTPRSQSDALITDLEKAVGQALRIAGDSTVLATEGTVLHFDCHQAPTICLHGDGPHALEFARAIHGALLEKGFLIQPA